MNPLAREPEPRARRRPEISRHPGSATSAPAQDAGRQTTTPGPPDHPEAAALYLHQASLAAGARARADAHGRSCSARPCACVGPARRLGARAFVMRCTVGPAAAWSWPGTTAPLRAPSCVGRNRRVPDASRRQTPRSATVSAMLASLRRLLFLCSLAKLCNHMSSSLKLTVVRALALRSGNQCAFPGCTQPLLVDGVNVNGAAYVGEAAHIAGEKPSAARYDPVMTDEERNGVGNLILLCTHHHTIIDKPGNIYTADEIRIWKYDHETRVEEAVRGALPEITFAELEVVARVVADGPDPYDGVDFSVTNPVEKMRRNGMTRRSGGLLRMGLAEAPQVRRFLEDMARYDSTFPDRLRAGFHRQYEKLWEAGERGDALFESTYAFACKHSADAKLRAASLAVVAYLFEACEVFVK